MTDSDHILDDAAAAFAPRAIAFVAAFIGLLLLGALVGYTVGTVENGNFAPRSALMIAGLIAGIAGSFYIAVSQWRKVASGPESSSARKSRNIYYIAMAVGAVLGVFIMLSGGPEMETLFSNQPIAAVTAIGAIVIWGVATPLITWVWWRTTDEHEIAAYSSGALIAFHAYIFIVPSWWMAARAGWLPAQDPMIIWSGIIVIWSIGWLQRKYF